MATLGMEREVVDQAVYDRTVRHFRDACILLPTFEQLADPSRIPPAIADAVTPTDPDAAKALNLFRVHWWNDATRREVDRHPAYLRLPRELTGVDAPILVAMGHRFPMIHAHKVLAAYACLAPRIVTGQFDPTLQRAIWPSTGNYCRGGVAISRIMGCRGVAVLPEGMSRERFQWLDEWVTRPGDIVRTPGTESNVKEIYDECHRLEVDPSNVIFNQFSEFGNHLVHYLCTGRALDIVYEIERARQPGLRLEAFVSATGSAGTIAAGDYLKDRHDTRIVAVEALECPTMLENGYGEHNIQGIGDKHIPLIHNVMNTDFVVAVSDRITDDLDVLFNEPSGRHELIERRGVPAAIVDALKWLGLSSICNVMAAITVARDQGFSSDQAVITVATDGSELYGSEHQKALASHFPDGLGSNDAADLFERHVLGINSDNLLELDERGRRRIFNLGYYTWVEQQGVSLDDFDVRRSQDFWRGLRDLLPAWDAMIGEFNARTGVTAGD